MRKSLSFVVAVVLTTALSACSRTSDHPGPLRTLDPQYTSSSEGVRSHRITACDLLTSEERTALTGTTMDQVIPVNAQPGTRECEWVHSATQPARAAIRVVSFNAQAWAQLIGPEIGDELRKPGINKAQAKRLRAAYRDLLHAKRLSTERICDIYWLLVRGKGFKPEARIVFYWRIGGMPAAYATECSDGVMTMAGYGEYGLEASASVSYAVSNLAIAAHEHAVEKFGPDASATPSATPTGSSSPSASTSATAKPRTPSPSGSAR